MAPLLVLLIGIATSFPSIAGAAGEPGSEHMTVAPIESDGVQRLTIMRDTDDGFRIAEEDLAIRGGGEILGTKQSGLPAFRFTDLFNHRELIQTARDDAKLILNNDPELESERGKALRVLLYLFEYDAQIRYLRSG